MDNWEEFFAACRNSYANLKYIPTPLLSMKEDDLIINQGSPSEEIGAFWIQGNGKKETWQMNNKYFTPEIEDIRVGYEYEKYIAGSGNDYEKLIFDGFEQLQFLLNCYRQNLQEGWIRVLYLTKEQLEKEGWEVNKSISRGIIRGSKKVLYKSEIRGSHFDYSIPVELGLIYNFETRVLEITYDCGEFADCRHFEGICKCINDFRYICKNFLTINNE